MNRDKMLKNAAETSHWDVIVVGGGITGLWCAFDAATRGFKTILIEKDDFSASASSKSTKLIHGGLRYLNQGKLSFVRESLREREILMRNAPHLVKPRAFAIPLYKSYERLFYGAGLGIYDFLSGSKRIESHYHLSSSELLEKCPTINSKNLRGGVVYTDGQCDDSRLSIELAKMCSLYEGTVLNYAELTSFIRQGTDIVGVEVKDLVNNNLMELRGKLVINATGVFTDQIRKMDDSQQEPICAFARGSHIVLDRSFLPSETAIVCSKTKDGRLAFILPWNQKVIVGTTDVKVDTPLLEPVAPEEDIDFLLSAAGEYLSKKPKRCDILSVFSGMRTLVKKGSKQTKKLKRSHKILLSKNGLLTITAGKMTTARKMAEDTLDFAMYSRILDSVSCKTTILPIEESVFPDIGQPLHPDLPYSKEHILHAIENEMAVKLTDVLARRTRAILLNAKATLEIAPSIALLMQKQLVKSDEWREREIKTFKTFARSYLPGCVE